MSTVADPHRAPDYLFQMPLHVLMGTAAGIEKWCREQGKQRPTLLHLGLARDARRGEQVHR